MAIAIQVILQKTSYQWEVFCCGEVKILLKSSVNT